jgi:hypothetical protein
VTRLGDRSAERIGAPYGDAVRLKPSDDLVLIPITQEVRQRASTGDDSPVLRFYTLTDGIVRWGAELSHHGRTAFIDVQFFGGTGFQAAIGWADGEVALGPLFTETHKGEGEPWYEVPPRGQPLAVNRVLQWLGVQKGQARDEFEAVDLGRVRDTEKWVRP